MSFNFKRKILRNSRLNTLESLVLAEKNKVYYEHQTKSTFAIVCKSFAAFLRTLNSRKTFSKRISFNACFL